MPFRMIKIFFLICPKSNHFSPLSKPSYLVSPFPPLTLKSFVSKIARDFFLKLESDHLIPCLISSKVKHTKSLLCQNVLHDLACKTFPLQQHFLPPSPYSLNSTWPPCCSLPPQGFCSHLNVFSQIFTFRYLPKRHRITGPSPITQGH